MSQQNVEIVKAALEAWNAGDMDSLRELYDPNVILRMRGDWPEPGPFMGRDAVMRQVKQLRDTWDADTLELISDFIDVGDRVAVRYVWRAEGRGPGLAAVQSSSRAAGREASHKHACIPIPVVRSPLESQRPSWE